MEKKLIKAIDLALGGQWDAAHQIVQQYDADATAAWIHAVLHQMEGDEANSKYWYRRAGQIGHFSDEPRSELGEIRTAVQGGA